MTKKIRAAVVGYGNIGKYAIEALNAADDFEIAGVVRRSAGEPLAELAAYQVVDDIDKLDNVDVAILCSPTRAIKQIAQKILAKGINTVDSFDVHSQIVDLKNTLDPIAKANNAVSVVAAGWDPGSDSIVRTLMLAMAPKGITYTNFGPGMSMGHSVAARAIPGVKEALSVTVPMGTGVHRRLVYIELEQGADFATVEKTLKADDYFASDETHVKLVDCVDNLKDMGHGVHLTHKGVSGETQNQLFEYSMRINNPALTSQFLVSAARATTKLNSGAYTVIEVAPIHFLQGETDKLIERLV
ncbi:diaminopimelate dehydrogenase [Budviciaceae bacterium CWB-B4]|uniref:Meso-diaminopimelate D-dehydrogenase n=1 Tax=Limnobaculum xujianqingii TaxID=2738837 RepID=A0A9D7AFY4_9GAMM|nr:diaminopimelate dehydrogenase [Limnobaculum xujianqingii]MBK5072040.1 diaminopimelate dehydrogenase [Limnobaculum xujianqingii]MBK5175349.1 diaminopimelate dehydrogenase [Limnobaculum xujianqingii]